MLFHLSDTVDDVVSLAKSRDQLCDLLGRMLEVVVHRDGDLVLRRSNAAQERAVLAIVTQQVDAAQPRSLGGKPRDDVPATVAAAVVDEYDFEWNSAGRHYRAESLG